MIYVITCQRFRGRCFSKSCMLGWLMPSLASGRLWITWSRCGSLVLCQHGWILISLLTDFYSVRNHWWKRNLILFFFLKRCSDLMSEYFRGFNDFCLVSTWRDFDFTFDRFVLARNQWWFLFPLEGVQMSCQNGFEDIETQFTDVYARTWILIFVIIWRLIGGVPGS